MLPFCTFCKIFQWRKLMVSFTLVHTWNMLGLTPGLLSSLISSIRFPALWQDTLLAVFFSEIHVADLGPRSRHSSVMGLLVLSGELICLTQPMSSSFDKSQHSKVTIQKEGLFAFVSLIYCFSCGCTAERLAMNQPETSKYCQHHERQHTKGMFRVSVASAYVKWGKQPWITFLHQLLCSLGEFTPHRGALLGILNPAQPWEAILNAPVKHPVPSKLRVYRWKYW